VPLRETGPLGLIPCRPERRADVRARLDSFTQLEPYACRDNEYGEVWSAARDTIRTLFLAPPPDVRAVFDQLGDEE
jgi:hypothetical protein